MRSVGSIPQEFLAGQTCFVVEHWGGSSSGDMSMADRATGNLLEAHVVSSKVRLEPIPAGDELWNAEPFVPDLHKVVLDIDHLAWLIPSSTPGHSHLYVDIPPVRWDDYVAFMQAAAKIGLVEQGYVDAAIRRGHSDVRLPWVQKGDGGDFLPKRPMLRCSFCKQPGHEIVEYREQVITERMEETEAGPAAEAEHARISAEITDSEVLEYIWGNEGTLDRKTGFFACTECYVKVGMPSSDAGWTAPAPQPQKPVDPPAAMPFSGPYGEMF